MSDGNWRNRHALIVFLSSLFAIVLVAWIENHPNPPISQPPYTAENTDADKRGPSEGYWWPEIAARDTYAQWAMMLFSLAATVISWKAVVYVRDTLVETRKAVEAAEGAVSVTREIGRAQVRAYLTCTGAEFGFDKDWLYCLVKLSNKGQSPATSIEIKGATTVFVGETGETGTRTFRRIDGGKSEGHSPVIPAAGESAALLVWSHVDIGTEIHDAYIEKKWHVSIDCKVTWTDVFGDEHSIVAALTETSIDLYDFNEMEFLRRGKLGAYNKET